MKARLKTCFATLLMASALEHLPAQPSSSAYLKDYETPMTKVRAGFVPDKTEVVLGEPLRAIFTVENLGPTNFEFWFGGDYRGTGRHDRFKIAITNASGEALPDSRPKSFFGGGFLQDINLKPNQTFSNVIDLTDFRVIDKPGVYTVSCSFAFDEQWRQKETTNPVVNSTFQLTILDRTPERVAKVLDELVAKTQAVHGSDLGDTMALIARFGTNDAVSRLAQLAKNGPVEFRTAAIGALPLIPTDASLKIALKNFKDSEPEIRSAAASALGIMQKPKGVEALLKELPKEKSPVAENIVRALGTSKSERAFPAITNVLETGGVEMQRAAIDGLVNFGGSNAAAVLREHINPNFLSLRYEIVLALADKLHQPMEAEWLLPVLMGREHNNYSWGDSLGLLQRHAGEKAIPTMLSCLDFDVAWSGRNYAILYVVKLCPDAPDFDYKYEFTFSGSDDPNYPDGTPEMWTNNLLTLQRLKAFAGPIPPMLPAPSIPAVPYLKTDPPIDFAPTFRVVEDGGVEIKSGFLTATIYHQSESFPYLPSGPYRLLYQQAAHLRSLPNASSNTLAKLNISQTQVIQLTHLLNNFATKLCGNHISDQNRGNYYSLLVNDSDYCTGSYDWNELFTDYREAPGWLKEQAKADLIDSVRVFSQNYHAGTVEFVEAAKEIFTPAQWEAISK